MGICPFADQSRRYDRSYPTQVYRGGPPKGVLHTTETSGLPGYGGGSMAPHFTLLPNLATKTSKVFQHFDTKRPSRALVDLAGGVETNNDGVRQIELVGTCSKGGPGLYWPDAPQWALDDLAHLMRWIEADGGVKRIGPPRGFLPYPSSYGASKVRMTRAEWDAFAGWCGHQHVPENAHGDPGDLPLAYLLNPTQEDDMSTQDVNDIKEYVGKLLVSGYTMGSQSFPGIAVRVERLEALIGALAEKQLTAEEVEAALRTVVEDSVEVRGDVEIVPKAGPAPDTGASA